MARIPIPNSEFRIPRILFVHNHPASFVKIDLALLRERCVVREWFQRGRAVNLVALRRAVAECDLVLGWFASWHTVFPILLARRQRKPSLLVVGGYDSANMPEIGYGSMRNGFKRRIARTTMARSSHLLPFSDAARAETLLNVQISPERVTTCYLGVPVTSPPDCAKENLVLTVGNVDRSNLQRKGLDPFVRAAAYLPDVPFVLIGAWRDDAIAYLKTIASPNVEFTGWVDDAQLQNFMARARVYAQASRHEGFGMAAAEAMLYECIPVVTRVGALPEVVGGAGVYAESNAPDELARAIQYALALDRAEGQNARARIRREFPIERRRETLFALLDRLLASSA